MDSGTKAGEAIGRRLPATRFPCPPLDPPIPFAAMSDLFQVLSERGFVQDATPGLAERLRQGPITAYVGFDPTADSLHVGNLVPVMGLAWLQRLGGIPIPLLGGGTGMVGDPSGKRTERPILSVEQIDANLENIRQQLRSFLDFEGPNAARMLNNADWLRQISLMEFLRDIGKHFTLSYMLQKESVKSRMSTGISYTEFSYMLTQAYDFWHLYRTQHCELQMGGSDQWGNITAGTELIARREQRQAHGLVFPLITTATGSKFGKSEAENVWLDPHRTGTHHFFQFWINTDDRDVERFLKLFTFLSLEEIARIVREHQTEPSRRSGQRRLAQEVTRLVHGDDVVRQEMETRDFLFGGEAAELSPEVSQLARRLAPGVPTVQISRQDLGTGLPLIDALVKAGLASSKADARRGILGKGYYVHGTQVDDVGHVLLEERDFYQLEGGGRYVLLRKGKKNHVALVVR